MSQSIRTGEKSALGVKHLPLKPIFARHETFHPRHGWLKKGLDKVAENPELFFEEECATTLGVGKNMAKAIRYWCWAFKLTRDDWRGPAGTPVSADRLGVDLFSPNGYDPFLEDPASLWLLHWQLLRPPCFATTWDFAFNYFREKEFSAESLLLALRAYISGKFENCTVSDSSLKNDVACFLRMYSKQPRQLQQISEESIDCPFVELGLLAAVPKTKSYIFVQRQKPSLPDDIVVSAALEFGAQVADAQSSILMARLLFDPGSPGMVFKIGETDLCNAVENIARQNNAIRLVESAGRLQLFWTTDPSTLSKQILSKYYRR